jgi:hypothetical protein
MSLNHSEAAKKKSNQNRESLRLTFLKIWTIKLYPVNILTIARAWSRSLRRGVRFESNNSSIGSSKEPMGPPE